MHDAASAQRWIADLLRYGVARLEAPLWWRLYHSWERGDAQEAARWNAFFVCSRETSELREETLQMGRSLRELLVSLDASPGGACDALAALEAPAYVSVAAFAAAMWRIPAEAALTAYC